MNDFTKLDELPFDVPDELGEVIDFQVECPGVYYIATHNEEEGSLFAREYYVVTDKATMISDKAKTYGQQLGDDSLLFYDLNNAHSGKYIIDYETLQYKIQNKLPLPEGYSIHEIAVFGRELHPEYFGPFPVPQLTPWGYTMRYKVLTNGLYWMETDTCQNVLAVCYPMQDTLSEYAVKLSRKTEYDAQHGLDTTMGYLFFSEKDSCVPLFELLEPHAAWKKEVKIPALMNAVSEYHQLYTLKHNFEEGMGWHDYLSRFICTLYDKDYESQFSPEHVISSCEQAGTKFLEF